jgi:hypothetical protein
MKTKKVRLAVLVIGLASCLGFTSLISSPVALAADAVETEDIFVQGAGTLTARGDGIAALGGIGKVELSGNGILWVKDLLGTASIEVTGYGQKKEFSDGWVQYAGFHGNAEIQGRRIIVVVAGVGINLEARGRGRVRLWGHGTYEINGHTGEWGIQPPTVLSVASDEQIS